MRHDYPISGNEDEFEDFCVRFYRHLLKRAGLVRYGKRGQKQYGIDVVDQYSQEPIHAIQSKCHERTKDIKPEDIVKEVEKAEKYPNKLDHYIIATTAKKSMHAQNAVVKLNQRPTKKFVTEIHFLEDINTRLCEFRRAVAEFIVYGEQTTELALEPAKVCADYYSSSSLPEDSSKSEELYPSIIELLKNRKIEAAEHEISKLPDPEKDKTLASGNRYAIFRLIAKLAFEQCEYDKASRYFLLAYEVSPHLSQAKQNRALALDLSSKHEEALAESRKLLSEGIKTTSLVCIVVRNIETIEELAKYREAIDEFIESEEDVNETLTHKYLSWNELALAEETANRAVRIAPTSAHALFTRGMVSHHAILQGEWESRPQNTTDAIRWYTDAIKSAKRDRYNAMLPEIYSNRGRVNGISGNIKEAATDYRKSVETTDKPSLYAEGAVSFFLHQQDYDSAWELLTVLGNESDEAKFLRTATEYHHAGEDDKKSHIVGMCKLAGQGIGRAIEARFHCVQWAIDLRDYELARSCLSSDFHASSPFQAHTLNGWIEFESGNAEKASEYIEQALDASSQSAHREEIATLARLLVRLGQDEKALPLLEQVYTPGVLDFNCKRLIDCAQYLDRHDILIRVCAELRKTNQQDYNIRKLEVQVLSHYAPDEAYELAKQFLEYDRSYFLVAKNFIACRLRKAQEIEFDDNYPPRPEDFSPEEADQVLIPYVETEKYREALKFLYQQLRINFSNELSHGKYMWFILQYGTKCRIDATEIVDNQSAVLLKNLITSEHRWITIEDQQPNKDRNEFSSDSQTTRLLIGKRVGDVVDIFGNILQKQEEKIVEIQSKHVRLFQYTISNFKKNFPDSTSFQPVHMGSGDEFDIAPILENARQRREHVEKVLEYYGNNPCSLHILANQIGVNQRQLIKGLSQSKNEHLQCVGFTPEGFVGSVRELAKAETIVLDISAIITIDLLSGWNHIDPSKKYLISQSTLEVVTGWLHDFTNKDSHRTSAYTAMAQD